MGVACLWSLATTAAGQTALSASDPHEVLLLVRNVPAHGVAMGPICLPAALHEPSARPGEASDPKGTFGLSATATVKATAVPVQLLPPAFGRGDEWRVVLKLPGGGDHRVRLKLFRQPPAAAGPGAPGSPPAIKVSVRTDSVAVTHDSKRMGGLPVRIEFLETHKDFANFAWNDRVYDKGRDSYHLRYDPAARVELVSAGPICTVVRAAGRYMKPPPPPRNPPEEPLQPPSQPRATYEWCYFHLLPLVCVQALVTQARPFAWSQLHFLELNFPDKSFPDWAGGEPLQQGSFTGTQKGFSSANWGLLRDGPNGVALLRGGRALFHDGRGGYGTYLHAYGSRTWTGWADEARTLRAWLWLGSDDDPIAQVRKAAQDVPSDAEFVTTLIPLRDRIEAARKEAHAQDDPAVRCTRMYAVVTAEKLEADGQWDLAQAQLDGRAAGGPPDWATATAGDLAVTLGSAKDGIRLQGLFDLATGTMLTSSEPCPLFDLSLRNVKTGRIVHLAADSGWGQVGMEAPSKKQDRLILRWRDPVKSDLRGLEVKAVATLDAPHSRASWSLDVTNPHDQWGVWRVAFPQVSLGRLGQDTRVLFPRGCGVECTDLWRQALELTGTYPCGWATMQFLAAYDATAGTGLYFAMHDPAAHTKDMLARKDCFQQSVKLGFDHPAPNMGGTRTGFALSGRAVWQVLRGDWFDAARIYRQWVRAEAQWYPQLTPQGRGDTPAWMRDLCIWGLLSGEPKSCVDQATRFVHYMGLPTGFHWYSWHQIPFDNDYPHFLPAKEGFVQAVAALAAQKPPAYVMPYINARLWDTRDKGTTDFEFTKVARPAATKDRDGQVYTEVYGSKESDGSGVKLAPMCPATKLWQERVRGIVLRLMNDCGTHAVYLDQLAAAQPRLCFDKSHGHPLGGGGWWVQGYDTMLADIRKAMPAGCALTSECNAEPYLRRLDGYLTWHWQYDGQVPAFPAVYGGAVQMFGRAFRGGPDRDRALRMKAGQQLVFGEQIGWIGPDVLKQKDNAAFLRRVAWMRYQLREYFNAGRMARPPKLGQPGEKLPTVTADWQWQGTWPVTTDAVLTGAWELPGQRSLRAEPAAGGSDSSLENRLVLIFVNVSGKLVTTQLTFDASAYGLGAAKVWVTTVTPDGPGRKDSEPAKFERKMMFNPHEAQALQITVQKGE